MPARDPKTGRFVAKHKTTRVVHHRSVKTGRFVRIGKGVRIHAHPRTGTPIAYHKATKRWRHVVYINGTGFWSDFVEGFKTGLGKTARLVSNVAQNIPGVGQVFHHVANVAANLTGHGIRMARGIKNVRVTRNVPQRA